MTTRAFNNNNKNNNNDRALASLCTRCISFQYSSNTPCISNNKKRHFSLLQIYQSERMQRKANAI